MNVKKIIISGILCTCVLASFAQVFKDASKPVNERVADLMRYMTLEDKIGQMTLVDFGPLSKNLSDIVTYRIGNVLYGGDSDPKENTPAYWAWSSDTMQGWAKKVHLQIPLLIGTDAVHGHSNIENTVIFPHNIGMGCSRNPDNTFDEGRITAIELAATGVRWAFAPCIAVPRDERWGRTFEGYSENPELVKSMGISYIKGFNSVTLPDGGSMLSCPKHFGGDGGTSDGIDRGNTVADEKMLNDIFLFPYNDSTILDAGSIMVSFNSLNGILVHGNAYLINEILKKKMGFKGFIVSDWEAIDLLPGDYYSDVKTAVNAGVDMFMEASTYKKFTETLKQCVDKGDVSMLRIDDAVARILTQKFKMGLFEHPKSYPQLISTVGSTEHRDAARKAVRESMVLLMNKDSILPISKNVKRIHVSGSAAHNMRKQCGGWTVNWQGLLDNDIDGSTVLQAIQEVVPEVHVTYSENGQGAAGADVGVVVIGEEPYAEWFGDRKDLQLSQHDVDVVKNVKNKNVPVICILMSGRPLILDPIINHCDVIIAAWLPGTEGLGVTDVLFGSSFPKGKLSCSWPRSIQQVPINLGDASYDPLFPYGHGITQFNASTKNSSPKLISASVTRGGAAIELSFTKDMSPNFQIKELLLFGEGKTYQVESVNLKNDSSYIVLWMKDTIRFNQAVMLSYYGASLRASDGGIFHPITNYNIINPMALAKQINKIPAMFQAEGYYEQNDIDIQECWDEGGGQNITIEEQEWVEYFFNSSVTSEFEILFRSQSWKGGFISVSIDDKEIGVARIPSTGFDAWKTVELKKIPITQGKHSMQITSKKGKISLNWIAFDTFVKYTKK